MWFNKPSELDKRIKKIEKELSSVSGDIRSMSNKSGKQVRKKQLSSIDTGVRQGEKKSSQDGPVLREDRSRLKTSHEDSRFSDYLASSLQGGGMPLRHERRIQRNKMILMIVIGVVVLLGVLSRVFLLS